MVQLYSQKFTFLHPWNIVSCAVFNKYPNPFASHVLSLDIIDQHVDQQGRFDSLTQKACFIPLVYLKKRALFLNGEEQYFFLFFNVRF
jgi:hypothetical protein